MNWLDECIEASGLLSFLHKNPKELYLYGAGETAKITIQTLKLYFPDIKMGGVLDNDPGKDGNIQGVPIIFAEEIKNESNIKIMITTASPYQIYQDALRLGVQSEDIYLPRTTYIIDGTFMNNWVTGTVLYKRMIDIITHKEQIFRLYDMLDTDISKEVLKHVVQFRLLLEPKLITQMCNSTNSDYWGDAPYDLSDNEALVDAGALYGDTSLEFLHRTNNRYDRIYLIEPDAWQLGRAMDLLFTFENRDKISYFHMAICDYNGIGHMTNGVVGDKTGQAIRCVRLDDLLGDKRISLIKMDIEGMEIPALKGAAGIIAKQKPKLCICVYHRSEDLWEIPNLIMQIRNDYRFALRQGSPGVYGDVQTVLYAY